MDLFNSARGDSRCANRGIRYNKDKNRRCKTAHFHTCPWRDFPEGQKIGSFVCGSASLLSTDQHPKSAGSLSLSNGSFLRSRYKTRAGNLRGSSYLAPEQAVRVLLFSKQVGRPTNYIEHGTEHGISITIL
jgi:hypothetical protein